MPNKKIKHNRCIHFIQRHYDAIEAENEELKSLACPFSEDALSIEDYRQKEYAKYRGLSH